MVSSTVKFAALAAVVAAVVLLALFPLPKGTTVKIGYKPNTFDLPIFIAYDRGYFQAEGVNVELVRFTDSNLEANALAAGQVQLAGSLAAPTAFTLHLVNNGSVGVFGYSVGTIEHPLSELLVKSDSKLSSVEDLKGRKIITYPGPLALSMTKMVLAKHGLNEGDYLLSQVDGSLHVNAIAGGSADAAFTYEPAGTLAKAMGNGKIIYSAPFEKEVISPWPTGAFLINMDAYSRDPKPVEAAMRAILRAFNDLSAEGPSANRYLVNFTGINESVARNVPLMVFWNPCQVDADATRKLEAIFVSNGVLSKHMDPDEMVVGRNLCG